MFPIRVLHIVPKLEMGGIGMMLLNYYQILHDNNMFIFDFVVHGSEIGELESEFAKLGCKIYHITPKKDNYKMYVQQLNEIFLHNHYLIVHAHQNSMSFIPLKIAKKNKIPIRIAHSHSCIVNASFPQKINRFISIWLIKKYATHYAYCSQASKKWVFGENMKNGQLILNGIDIDLFKFNLYAREAIRKELKLEDKTVLGFVGRLDTEKNVSFILQLLSELPTNYSLIIIGNGPLYGELNEMSMNLKLNDRVLFLGAKNDVYKYYNAFDVLLLPSFFEAFPVTLIESQTNGLVSLVSENIPEDVRKTELVKKVKLSDEKEWLSHIREIDLNYDRSFQSELNDFSSKSLGKKLEDYYLSLLKELKE